MTTLIPLHSGWTVRAVDPAPDSPAAALPQRIPATVPGVVHTDLLSAALIDDPYFDLNEAASAWIGHTTWAYETRFVHDRGEASAVLPGERVDLVFDGLDTVATVLLNGTEIGRTANQHRTYRFDVSALLRPGPNDLQVVFSSAWEYARAVEARLGALPNVYPAPFNMIRKSACNFGWDWGPELVTAGIWRGVRLEAWSVARIASVRPAVDLDGSTGRAHVTVDVDQVDDGAEDGAGAAGASALTVVATLGGQTIRAAVEDGRADLDIAVPDVDVWWPVGMGRQALYALDVTLEHGGGVVDEKASRIGFRRVRLDTSADASGSTAFTVVVNEVPLFIRGANWIPDDCFPSRVTAARYEERIEQALGAHLNLLRVWGGGIYESDEFYDICDERGILVWQDFLFACAAYPEEEPIRGEVEAEARDNIARLSPHPSLVLWNGSNENIMFWFDRTSGWQEAIGDRTWGLGYYLDVLPRLVGELAPNTPYWASSPYSGSMDVDANDPRHGPIHIWDVWNEVDYLHYADYRPRFVSEFGFQGPPTWSTLTRSIHDDPLAPDSPAMRSHQKAEDGEEKLRRGLLAHFPDPADTEDWHFAAQLNQARAVRFGIEGFRAQRPSCMGTIVWQLNDCWPVTSWAAVDGYGRRKPLWHGLRRANAERLLTVQPTPGGGLTLHAINDGVTSWRADAVVSRRDVSGAVLTSERVTLTVPPLNQLATPLGEALFTAGAANRELVVVELDGTLSTSRLFVDERDLRLVEPSLRATVSPWAGGMQVVTLTAAALALGVTLFVDRIEPAAWVDDTDLVVLPGATVTVTVHAPREITEREVNDPRVLRSANGLYASRA